MKSIMLLFCFFSLISFSIRSEASEDLLKTEIYFQNEYTIQNLDLLLRHLNRKLLPLEPECDCIELGFLSMKAASLHFIAALQIDKQADFPDFNNSKHNLDEFRLHSHALLAQIPSLFEVYSLSYEGNFEAGSNTKPGIELTVLYKQLLEIERRLFSLKKVISPKHSYQIIQRIQAWLTSSCHSIPSSIPLEMGMRPRDAYIAIFDYVYFIEPNKGLFLNRKPGRIISQDSFNAALLALRKTQIKFKTRTFFLPEPPAPKILLTPSHVFQAIKNAQVWTQNTCKLNEIKS